MVPRTQQITAIAWIFLGLISYASSTTNTLEVRELGFADYPACSIQCTLPAMPASDCALTDMPCICADQALQQTIGACLLANCSMADMQRSAKVQAALCNLPNDSRRRELTVYTAVTHSLTTVSVVLRLVSKYVARRLSWDDAVLVFCYSLDVTTMGIRLEILDMGLGEHVWNLKDGVLLPLLRTWYVGAVFYIAVIGLLKACVILFYLDIFSTAYPRFRTAAYSILAYITLNTLILVFLTIFACRPIATFWNRDIKGKCLDIPAIGYAVGVSAIVQDIILLVLPLTVIGSLSMDRLRKISAGFLFSIGAFGCIATVLRLHTNPYIKVSLDPTWDYASGMIWVELEVCAIYVCISLPSIRILVVRLLPARCRNLFGKMAERIGDGEHFPQRDAKGGGAAHSPAALPTSDQLRSPPRGFFSRILPQTSIWSRFTASGAGGGGSRGLFSTGRNESQVAITRASVDMGEGSAELQESFQLFRKYWNKEMRGGGNEGMIQSQV